MNKLLNRAKIDIVEAISNYVELTKGGYDHRPYYKGACPFHEAVNNFTSFNVYPSIQRFVCWSCMPEGGDVLDFLSKINGISLEEARALGTVEVVPETVAIKKIRVPVDHIDEVLVASRCFKLTQLLSVNTCLQIFKKVDEYMSRQQYILLDQMLRRYGV